MNIYNEGDESRIGKLMGGFFSRIAEVHDASDARHIDGLVNSVVVMIDQLEELSFGFRDFLKYVVKKAGEQKKMEIRFACKHPKSGISHV